MPLPQESRQPPHGSQFPGDTGNGLVLQVQINSLFSLFPKSSLGNFCKIDGLIILYQIPMERDAQLLQFPYILLPLFPAILRLQKIQKLFHISHNPRPHPVSIPVVSLPFII